MIHTMPITIKKFDDALDLSALASIWIEKLDEISIKLGLTQEKEVSTKGGRIDIVWFKNFENRLPYIGEKLPLIGFEIETSWRTRKHIKGDLFNLMELNPSLGVILFLSQGFKTESKFKGNLKAAKKCAESISGSSNIQIWTDENVKKIYECLFNNTESDEPDQLENSHRTASTNTEKTIQYLKDNPSGSCDDCISTRLKITPRQQVNQICRRLSTNGIIERKKEKCPFCQIKKLNNKLNITTVS